MRKKILIIDDDVNLATIMRQFLVDKGFDVETAFDAYAGVAAAGDFRPDLILLDLQMPAGGGAAVCVRISQNMAINKTPIIFITSASQKELKEQLPIVSQAKGHFKKPVDTNALMAAIDRVLGADSGGSTPPPNKPDISGS
ncbi:MAG: response regulator [Elusimicrobiota bacterium]